MKKIICGVAAVFAFSTVGSPTLLTLANYESNIQLTSEVNLGDNFKLLYDDENKSAYQIVDETGNIYEYEEEVISQLDGTDEITRKKFLVLSNKQKELVDEKVISIGDTATDIIIKDLSNPYSTEIKIDKSDLQFNTEQSLNEQSSYPVITNFASASVTSGGSYLADIRYTESKNNNNATAIFGTSSKNTTQTNWKFRDFKAAADNIVTEEKSLVTLGVAGVADAVWAAVKAGDLLSWEVIKKVFGKLGKAVPAIGTLVTIYTYVNLCLTAKEKYNAI
ncbi:hypothetical protein [Lysinibacillus sp. UGB7]|uniref:hypothetical protein n=1 Tax=Lysinibacillus TaxID=400634 RepID=UPI003B82193C